jgi:hypothetical protein
LAAAADPSAGARGDLRKVRACPGAATGDERSAFRRGIRQRGLPRSRADIQDFIEKTDDGLARLFAALRDIAQAAASKDNVPPPTILLALDQGEELFNEEGRDEAKRFIEILTKTLTADPRALAILVMRSDSFPLVQGEPSLAALPKDTFTLDMMLEGSYRAVIEGPAKLVQPNPLKIDPLLTDALLEDLSGQDALPLLAFTLAHLYDNYSAAFSPDGARIVTASKDKTARIWDAATGQPIGKPLKGHLGAVLSAAYSLDGRRIVTASWDKTARIWDAATGEQIGPPLKGHRGSVSSAAFSPDGKHIVTASDDRTVRLWDAATGEPFGQPLGGHRSYIWSAAFSPDGGRIVSASQDKTARLWDFSPGVEDLIKKAKAAVPRCLTAQQREAVFLLPDPPAWCIETAKWPYDTLDWKKWLSDKRAGKKPPLPAAP